MASECAICCGAVIVSSQQWRPVFFLFFQLIMRHVNRRRRPLAGGQGTNSLEDRNHEIMQIWISCDILEGSLSLLPCILQQYT